MKIKRIGMFIFGVIDILLAITIVAFVIFGLREVSRLLAAGICLVCGVNMVVKSIETKNQRLRRKEELKEMAKMFGWDKEEE